MSLLYSLSFIVKVLIVYFMKKAFYHHYDHLFSGNYLFIAHL